MQVASEVTKVAQVVQKLHSAAKIVQLQKNIKIAQNLRCTKSQFSVGTTKNRDKYTGTLERPISLESEK